MVTLLKLLLFMKFEEMVETCAVSKFTQVLGGKWKLFILSRLREIGKMRFGQLAATIRQVSRKALTNQFKKVKKKMTWLKESTSNKLLLKLSIL